MFTAAKHFSVKNGRFRASGEALPDENRAAKDEVLHTRPTFVHVFCSNFATFRVSVSTPNFQKSTPNFQKALTFFLNERRFLPKSSQSTDNQPFKKPSKNGLFFVQKLFSWRILEIGRPKTAILSILFKKIGLCKSVSQDGCPFYGNLTKYALCLYIFFVSLPMKKKDTH